MDDAAAVPESAEPADGLPEGAIPLPPVGSGAGETAAQALAAIAAGTPQPLHLSARITENGAIIPQGLVWRIFDTRTDATGELALAAKSEDATADFNLPPGRYVVHVAYGRAQASDTITVEQGFNEKSMILDAGALRLGAMVTGDVPIPLNLLRFNIYGASGSETERNLVAEKVAADEIVTLNAGTYHVVSYFGGVNAVVRADLRVEPGKMTEATLYHRAAQVSFKLVTEKGGEAIADVDWSVRSATGDLLFSNIGAFPATVLEEGDYVVTAKRGDQTYSLKFSVEAGAPREVEVLTTPTSG